MVKKGGLWLLDAVLLAIVTPYITGIWEYVTNQSTSVVFKIIMFIIGIVAFAILTTYLIMRHWDMLKGEKRETSVDVFSHNNLPSIQEIFSKVNYGIHIVGISLESLNHILDTIDNVARNGKKVRILLCHPEHNFMPEIEELVISTKTSQRIDGTLGMLNQVKNNLGDNRNKLEIKTYKDIIPTNSMIIIDPDTGSGFMQLEPYPFKTHQQNRKIFRILEQEQAKVFDVYWSSYEKMWNAS